MRISAKNAQLLRQMIADARWLKVTGRLRHRSRGNMSTYWLSVGHFNSWYGANRKTSELWQKVRGRVGD